MTVRELRQAGLGDYAAADLTGDGVVDGADIAAFLGGERPSTKRPLRTGSRIGK